MKRVALWVIGGVVLLTVVLVATAAWLVGTEGGTRTAWRFAAPALPEGVTVAALEGRLVGPLRATGVTYRSDTLVIEIDRVALEWRPASLLDGMAEVQALDVNGVAVTLLPADEPAPAEPTEPFEMPASLELPVDGVIERLTLAGVRYRATPEAEFQTLVDRVVLGAQWNDAAFALHVDEAAGPAFSLEGEARVVPREPYEVEAQLSWTVQPDPYAPASGTTVLSGSLASLNVEQRIAEPYDLDATVTIAEPLGGLALDGRIELSIASAELGGDLPEARISAAVDVEGALDGLAVALQAEVGLPGYDETLIEIDAVLGEQRLTLDRVALRHPVSGASLRGTGRVALAEPTRLELDAQWNDLRWPLRDEPMATSASGGLRLDGSLDAFRFDVDADLDVGGTAGQVELAGSGSAEQVELETLEVAMLGGRLSGDGGLRFAPSLDGRVRLDLENIDPGALLEGWPGQLDGALRATVRSDNETLSARLEALELNGRLRGRDLELDASGAYIGDTIEIEQLSLVSGSTTLEAQGSVADRIDARLRLDSDDLADLWPELSGRLTLAATAIGPRERPRVTLDAEGSELALPDVQIDTLSADADVDLAGEASSTVSLELGPGVVMGTDLESVRLSGQGNASSHTLMLEAAAEPARADVALAGRIERPWEPGMRWQFELQRATLDPSAAAAWQLVSAAQGRVSGDSIALDRACWRGATEGELCIDAARDAGRTTANLSLTALPFDALTALATDLVSIEGTLSAEAELVLPAGGTPVVNAMLSSTPSRVVPRDADDVEIAFGPLQGRAVSRNEGIEVELHVPLTERGQIDLNLGIGPPDASGGRPLEGRIDAAVDELEFVSQLTDLVEDASGTLTSDLSIGGTLDEPELRGRLALVGAGGRLPNLNITLENLQVEVTGDPAGDLVLAASAESNGGQLRADGNLELAAGGPFGRITVTGQRFEAIDTRDARVLISPDLVLALETERLNLTGTVRVPEARITPAGGSTDAVTVSSDEVIVESDEEVVEMAEGTRPLYADVTLELGEQVEIEASGLTGQLGGQLRIVEVPGEPTTGSGELRVDGTYVAYGQELEVRTGRLLFAGGPITRPGLDIEAVREPAEDILVGARVRGTLEQPELSLFSEPTMPQQDQLSYLVLGRPLQGASSSEESALSRAALALGLRGGNFVSERINENLGLDEFGIQTQPGESASSASFVIGKYLSPSLYVSYGVGLFEPVNTLNLRYTISDRWQLLTESSSEGSGGDIIYSIERFSDSLRNRLRDDSR